MKFAKPRYIPAMLTVGLLLGLTVDTLRRPSPANADPYHTRVKLAISQVVTPKGWTFVDGELPSAAITLLRKPDFLYRKFQTAGHPFQLLLIHCRDARDMGGHYPPICYPSSGWVRVVNNEAGDTAEKKLGKPLSWDIGGRVIVGMEYEFTGTSDGQTINRTVDDLLILPSGPGRNCYILDINDVRAAAADYNQKFYGATQIQLIFDGAVSETERRDLFTQLIGQNMNLLTVLEHPDEPRTTN